MNLIDKEIIILKMSQKLVEIFTEVEHQGLIGKLTSVEFPPTRLSVPIVLHSLKHGKRSVYPEVHDPFQGRIHGSIHSTKVAPKNELQMTISEIESGVHRFNPNCFNDGKSELPSEKVRKMIERQLTQDPFVKRSVQVSDGRRGKPPHTYIIKRIDEKVLQSFSFIKREDDGVLKFPDPIFYRMLYLLATYGLLADILTLQITWVIRAMFDPQHRNRKVMKKYLSALGARSVDLESPPEKVPSEEVSGYDVLLSTLDYYEKKINELSQDEKDKMKKFLEEAPKHVREWANQVSNTIIDMSQRYEKGDPSFG